MERGTEGERRNPVARKARAGELDLLRFFAAILVILFHYTFSGYAADGMSIMPYPLLAPLAKYGYLGVHLFFMISGFVILMSASDGDLSRFVASRVARLYPALWVCCTATALASWWIGGGRYHTTIPQYFANMALLSGFIGVPAVDGAYWSLFVEIKLYAIVAMALISGQIARAEPLLVAWLGWVGIAVVRSDGQIDQMTLASPFFIAGAFYYQIWSRGSSNLRWIGVACALTMTMYYATKTLPSMDRYYGTRFDPLTVGAILLVFHLLLALVATRKTGAIEARSWLLVGSITYPLYLLHQYIGLMIFNLAYPQINSHVLLGSTVLLMIASAYVVHRFIERPLAPLVRRGVSIVLAAVRDARVRAVSSLTRVDK